MVQNAFQYKKFFYLKKTPYSLAIIFMLSASLAGLLFCNALGLKDYARDKILSFFGDCTTIESADYQLPFCAMSPIINYFSPRQAEKQTPFGIQDCLSARIRAYTLRAYSRSHNSLLQAFSSQA